MADGSEVLAEIRRPLGVKYAALTPNLQGLERAIDAGVDEVQFLGSHIGRSLFLPLSSSRAFKLQVQATYSPSSVAAT